MEVLWTFGVYKLLAVLVALVVAGDFFKGPFEFSFLCFKIFDLFLNLIHLFQALYVEQLLSQVCMMNVGVGEILLSHLA